MKKLLFLTITITIVIALALTACGPKSEDATPTPNWQATVVALQQLRTATPTPFQPSSPTPKIISPTPSAPNTSTTETRCPTEKEFQELTGIRADRDYSEACMFHWRGDPLTITSTNACPSGWICTTGVAENPWQTYVVIGEDGIRQTIFSITARLIDSYPDSDAVHDACTFLRKVQNEGQSSDPQWTAKPWNFSCP